MTFTTPRLDPARRAQLRDFLVAEVERTPSSGQVLTLAPDAPRTVQPALDWTPDEAADRTRTPRRWVPALVAAGAAGVVAVGVVAVTGGSGTGPAQPAEQPTAPPAAPTASDVRLLSADELAAMGAGRSGYGLVARCLTAAGWNAVYSPLDESIEGSLAAADQARYDADWVLCSAAAAIGSADRAAVTDDVWTALYAHAQQVADCVDDLGVPVQPLPDRSRFAETYGGMNGWVPYPGDPGVLRADQVAGIDACATAAG